MSKHEKKHRHKHREEEQEKPTVRFARDEPEKPDKATGSVKTTLLQVAITENSEGDIKVEYLATIKGTQVVVPMRPSHVLGQLEAAKDVLANQFYGNSKPL